MLSDKDKDRRKAIYCRAICGVRKAILQNKRICFITLTTSSSTADGLDDCLKMDLISKDWNNLRVFIEWYFDIKLEYLNVTTNEGNGVIHLLVVGLPFVRWYNLVRWWNYYHGSQLVSIAKVNGEPDDIANYLMSQYLANQRCLFRFKITNNFICSNFSKWWKVIKNSSRNFLVEPETRFTKDGYEYHVFPIIKDLLKENFLKWIGVYIETGRCLEYV